MNIKYEIATSLVLAYSLSFGAVAGHSQNHKSQSSSKAQAPRPAKATAAPSASSLTLPRDNENDPQPASRKRDILREVKTARDDAVKANTSGDETISKRLERLDIEISKFEADIDASTTETRLQTLTNDAKALVSEAGAISDDARNLSSNETGGLFNLKSILGVVVLLLGLLAFCYALFAYFKLHQRLSELEQLHRGLRKSHDQLKQVSAETKGYSENLGSNLAKFKDEMTADLDGLKRAYLEAMRSVRTAEVPIASHDIFARTPIIPVEVGPSFPSLVSDYLSKTPSNKKTELESDFRTNLLVPTPGGPFTLVEDDDDRGTGIVLPKPRLQKSVEYSSYYKGYYHCDSPSAGEVYIVEPAIVSRASAGWALYRMGTLEVR